MGSRGKEIWALGLVALVVSACGQAETSSPAESGTLSGPCYGNATCNAGLVCVDDVCVGESASDGELGGPCYGNGTCNAELICVDGGCESVSGGTDEDGQAADSGGQAADGAGTQDATWSDIGPDGSDGGPDDVGTFPNPGASAHLGIFPDPVNFGWKAVGQSHTLLLTLSNDGTSDLVVSTLELTVWSSTTLALEDATALPLTLAPGEASTIMVVFSPTPEMTQTTGPIGGIHIESNAADGPHSQSGSYVVDIFG
ncbi:MAG: hypothetical protein QF464_05325, partial [Myxococcota bacterium]|nr:hypothetical protein [Myxococcota bacterium]